MILKDLLSYFMFSYQHFYYYLVCIGIVAAVDTWNSIVRLKPDTSGNERKKSESDKQDSKNSSRDKGTLTWIYIAKFVPNAVAILLYYFYPNSRYSSLLNSNISLIIGLSLFVIGFAIRQIAIIQLGRFYTYKVHVVNDHEMIDTGLYQYMRHPAYTGTFLELTGAAILYNHTIISCFLSLPYLVVVLKRIKQEEKVLLEKFGPKYQKYCKRVGMFLPMFRL